MADRESLEARLNTPCSLLDVLAACVVQDDRKLLAAIARCDVERPAGAKRQTLRDLPQDFVTSLMAVVIVVGLEVIDVDQDQRERRLVANRLRPDALDVVIESAPIVDTGQAVAARGLDQQALLEEIRAIGLLERVTDHRTDDVG